MRATDLTAFPRNHDPETKTPNFTNETNRRNQDTQLLPGPALSLVAMLSAGSR